MTAIVISRAYFYYYRFNFSIRYCTLYIFLSFIPYAAIQVFLSRIIYNTYIGILQTESLHYHLRMILYDMQILSKPIIRAAKVLSSLWQKTASEPLQAFSYYWCDTTFYHHPSANAQFDSYYASTTKYRFKHCGQAS